MMLPRVVSPSKKLPIKSPKRCASPLGNNHHDNDLDEDRQFLKTLPKVKECGGKWFQYDRDYDNFTSKMMKQSLAKRALLVKFSQHQLDEVARVRDEQLRARLVALGMKRFQILLKSPQEASEIRRLEAELTTSYFSGAKKGFDGTGRITKTAFVNFLSTKTKLNNRKKLVKLFETFAAIQHLRSNLLVHEFDVLDARELIAACKLSLSTVRDSVRRLTSDLFSCFHPSFVTKDELKILLSLGVESESQLINVLARVDNIWDSFGKFSDLIKGRMSRDDVKVLLEQGLGDLMIPVRKRVQQDLDVCSFTHVLLCPWEAHFLPKQLWQRILALRMDQEVEARFLAIRHRERMNCLGNGFKQWARNAIQRRLARSRTLDLMNHWKKCSLQQAFKKLMQHGIQTIAVCRIQALVRAFLGRNVVWKLVDKITKVITIQARVRGMLTREKYHDYGEQRFAASIKIQQFYRSKRLRYETRMAYFRKLRFEWNQQGLDAAIKIQSVCRMYLAKLVAISKRRRIVNEQMQLRRQRLEIARMYR